VDSVRGSPRAAGSWLSAGPGTDPHLPNAPAVSCRQYGAPVAVPADFVQATIQSFLMIIASEIGDKTFLIAAILAMTQYGRRCWRLPVHASPLAHRGLPFPWHPPCAAASPRLLIFSGAFAALVIMTVLSAALGYAVPALLPRIYVHYLSIVFFAYFGAKMLKEWSTMDPAEAQEELAETEGELKKVTDVEAASPSKDLEAGAAAGGAHLSGLRNLLYLLFTPIWIQTFTLTFVAEWGDRSQIATIAMAAAANPFGITFGAILGHAICTGIAVIGGRLLAARISPKAGTDARHPSPQKETLPRVRARA